MARAPSSRAARPGMTPVAAARGDDADVGQELTLELLASQHLRAVILAWVFAIVGVLLAAAHLYEVSRHGASIVPAAVVAVVLGTSLYEFAMRRYIGLRLRALRAVPRWAWYLNAFAEVTVPTLAMLVSQGHFLHPLHVFLTPAVYAYYLFIMLSALNLDFRVSLFAGAVAAAQYLGLALFSLQPGGDTGGLPGLVSDPVVYFFKALLLFATGAGAAFVSAQFRERVVGAMRAAQERNRAREADRLKSRFLANMSHEIRTPLNAILGFAQLLETDPRLPVAFRAQVSSIGRNGAHLLELINDVLDLSKIEAGREEALLCAFDLRTLAQELAAQFQMRCEEKGIGWRMAIDPLPQRVHGDERRLRQILANLLSNSVKLTEHGYVGLNVLARGEDRYLFEVLDTGPGLAPERRARIFAPFEQDDSGREKGGTGLGLAIASQYARLLGGTLELESAPGRDTRFFFTLRLAQPQATSAAAQEDPWMRSARLCAETPVAALVVDDVEENRVVLARMLERAGVRVTVAAGGEEALGLAARGRPDIVFLDVRMPGMSIREVRDRIEATRSRDGVKFVAVSASVLVHERAHCLEQGFDHFIEKPVRMGELYDTLSRLLGARFAIAPPSEVDAKPVSDRELRETPMPQALRTLLTRALEAHDMSQTRQLLEQLEALDGQQRLAGHLRSLARRYDIQAMRNVLKELPCA